MTKELVKREWMSDALAHIFERAPEVGGIFSITASENLTNCHSHFRPQSCPRCSQRKAWDVIAEVADSFHSGVIEIIVKKGARSRYSTIQNWSTNVFNLVTQRAKVFENATHEWVDANLGSKVTMKYPSCYLMEPGAHGEMLSMAFAGPGQTQDAGSKMYHFAPNTSSKITSKSISKGGGRASYRGLLKVYKGAKGVKSNAVCDALLLDPQSRSDTYPYIEIDEDDVTIGHEASVSKVGEEQLFYLMSHGIPEEEASKLIVNGFIEPIVKELPMEYAVEMNRLIELQMEGSIG